ncbi:hypothetical protein Msil_1533 [Methylocella silvestris BL2]|uniref:Uncharacterized protein n=1 Tax=Methylocella silvestris (strain DSM 15510 / CIP 108128 / LMG 27833 / NCIMB 13906 / BL2) TaxID=395965 RepID=B8EI01_METSB|nr:hypothetical protein [Methylocella silvestris]ACK50483.1 hypothetical protein Msil_1533 [Methylocella silvestris BL2]
MSPLNKRPAPAASDPVFAVIAAHRAALAARAAAESVDDDEAFIEAHDRETNLHRRLFATRATSLEGAQQFAEYIAEIPNLAEHDGEHFSAVRAMRTLAAALLEIGVQHIRKDRPRHGAGLKTLTSPRARRMISDLGAKNKAARFDAPDG